MIKNNFTHLCAVGDSFMFGEELIETHYADQFQEYSAAELRNFGYSSSGITGSKYQNDLDKFMSLLDEVRFTSLLAKKFNLKHLNYAVGGASQESIKFQAMLLMDYLKKNKINPADTLWLVGLTMPTRLSFLKDPVIGQFPVLNNNAIQYTWSRQTSQTFFSDNSVPNNSNFDEEFSKGLIVNLSNTEIFVSWAMNIIDTINLMKVNNVGKFLVVNLFTSRLPSFQVEVPNRITKELLTSWATNEIRHNIVPGQSVGLDTILNMLGTQCPKGHPNDEGNRRIANYLFRHLTRQSVDAQTIIDESK